MSGVGSTNAMKKGSGNNPFLAYSKADMQGFLNSAYTGRIVKYAGPSTKTGVPRGNNLNLGDAQNLVVDLTKSFTYNQGLSKSRSWYITIDTETGNKCIMDITINKQTGVIGTPVLISDTIKALIYSIYTPYSSLIGRNINDLDVKFLSVTGTDVDRDVVTNWPTTSGWQKDCFNDSGKITLWGYGEKVTAIQNQNDMDYWSAYPILYTEPYVANVLYKVVYGNGQYYFEEYYHISENVTTATVEDVAPGKTFYDFTGTKQTGTGTKINPYLATDLDTFKSFPTGSFIKWLGPDRTMLDETTGQMLIQNEIYRAVEEGDILQYVILPTLSNPADPIDVAEGKEVINQLGAVMIGTGNNVLQASTTEGMQALFIDANIGKIAKYVGETDVYIKDAFYLITADASAKQYYELPELTNEGTASDLAQGKQLIDGEGKIVEGEMEKVTNYLPSLVADELEEIPFDALKDCTKLSDYALYNKTNLKTINVPATIKTFGRRCTEGCSNLTKVNIESLRAWLESTFGEYGNLVINARHLYVNNTLLTNLVKNDTDGITNISDYAFQACTDLTTVELSDSVETIGSSVFSQCTNLTTFSAKSVTTIPERCFDGASLVSIDIPNVTIIMGAYSMGGGSRKSFIGKDLIFPKVTRVDQSAFYYCGAKSMSFPVLVKAIGAFTFHQNNYLEQIDLPNMEDMPSSYFLYSCTKIKSITLPKLKTFRLGGISYCNSLKTIDLPSVITISDYSSYCFSSMSNVRLLLRYNGVVSLSAKQLPNAITEVYVPSEQVDNYKTDAKWSVYANKIKSLDDFVE